VSQLYQLALSDEPEPAEALRMVYILREIRSAIESGTL
jgi:hypothetical protein